MPSQAEVLARVLELMLDAMVDHIAEFGSLKATEFSVFNIDNAGNCVVTVERSA